MSKEQFSSQTVVGTPILDCESFKCESREGQLACDLHAHAEIYTISRLISFTYALYVVTFASSPDRAFQFHLDSWLSQPIQIIKRQIY